MTENPVLTEAASLDPMVGQALSAGAYLEPPKFVHLVQCPAFPAFSGEVVLRYTNVSDALAIERVSAGGRFLAEVIATIQVVCEKAPASWYKMPSVGPVPQLDLGRIPDVESVIALYLAYTAWRDDFRTRGV